MFRERHVDRHIGGGGDFRRADAEIATLATRQEGVVHRDQLRALGLGDDAIDARIRGGRLHPRHRGVYSVGHRRLSRAGRYLAAVLSAGDGAVLSHRSAADLWRLRASTDGRIDVIATTHQRGDREVLVHRTTLGAGDITTCQGVPITTPLRTIVDLASCVPAHQLEPAIRQAVYRRLTTTTLLAEAVDQYGGRRGVRSLRRALASLGEAPGRTRSDLEDRFIRFLRKHSLPMPELNAAMRVDGRDIEVDCLWRAQRVIVELDGRAGHDSTIAFESDRARDAALTAGGWRVVRVTWARIKNDPARLAHQLRALLAKA